MPEFISIVNCINYLVILQEWGPVFSPFFGAEYIRICSIFRYTVEHPGPIHYIRYMLTFTKKTQHLLIHFLFRIVNLLIYWSKTWIIFQLGSTTKRDNYKDKKYYVLFLNEPQHLTGVHIIFLFKFMCMIHFGL